LLVIVGSPAARLPEEALLERIQASRLFQVRFGSRLVARLFLDFRA
jgi:hypothetical protein